MKIAVIGSGYVGLVAGACFADSGNNVICVDINEEKIKKLTAGIPVIYEPGLEDLMKRNIREKRLHFTTDIKSAVENSQVIFIAVGTPPDEDGSADLKHVISAAQSIGEHMNEYKIIVNKSTVPVGTSHKVRDAVKEVLIRRKVGFDCDVVSNPEFLKEGTAIQDFTMPDRIIIGSHSEHALKIISKLYAPFLRTDNRIYLMDNASAEVTKYAANSILATKISFMNEIARLCEKVGANIDQVRVGIGSDRRIGQQFLFPGIGYGGSCFPKDVKALIRTGNEQGVEMKILTSVEHVNEVQKEMLFHKLTNYYQDLGQTLKDKRFAVWGLSFKPKTDDMREAPSIVMIDHLLSEGAQVSVYDPVAIDNARDIWGDRIQYFNDMYSGLEGAEALLIHTEWNEFRNPDFDRIRNLLIRNLILDGRNLYQPRDMMQLGFDYYSIGR